jgi:anaerobic ribonucleoside-triphosphate reductase activating protein
MKILGLEKLSLVDYGGYACAVVFTGGCNFACPFCHNAGIVEERFEQLSYSFVMDYLRERKGLLDAVCVSGGEPTLQPDLIDFLLELKSLGYKVKLDTNGTNPTILKQAIDMRLVDYVAMDIKNCWDNYPTTIGRDNSLMGAVKESLQLLKTSEVDYELRTTIVDELHNDECIAKMAEELNGAKRLFLQKFVSNENCFAQDLHPVSLEKATSWQTILSKTITDVKLRGYA